MTLEERVEEYIEKNCKMWEEGELTVDEIVRLAIIGFTKELEKENAELKEHIKADCIDCADYIKNKRLEKENTELKDKNTEAKEIIRALLFHLNKDTFAVIYETREESIKKAEQFLKE